VKKGVPLAFENPRVLLKADHWPGWSIAAEKKKTADDAGADAMQDD